MIALLLALAAGVLTVAAPCILPMLPILLGALVSKKGQAILARFGFHPVGLAD